MSSLVYYAVILMLFCVSLVTSLECYVCHEQEDNEGKCAKTVKLCGRDDTHCLSIIKWGSKPYWTQGAPKQYFVSKFCANRATCDRVRKETLPRCERIGYNDWECSECCEGDRCNFFVTLSGTAIKSSWAILASGLILTALFLFRKP